MEEARSLSHTKWKSKYHLVFIPKMRRKVLYDRLRGHLGDVLHRLAQQKESKLTKGT